MYEIEAYTEAKRHERLKEAARDIRYLLERGYRRDSAIRFAADHYRLEKKERYILARTVLTMDQAFGRKEKKIECSQLRNRMILIDGYNVLITMESLISGSTICVGDDSFTRDIKGVFRKHSNSDVTSEAVETLLGFLVCSEIKSACVLLDTQIRNSGELAAFIRRRMKDLSIQGDARTSRHVDHDLKNCEPDQIVATADGIIIDSVKNVVDIPGCIYPHILKGKRTLKV